MICICVEWDGFIALREGGGEKTERQLQVCNKRLERLVTNGCLCPVPRPPPLRKVIFCLCVCGLKGAKGSSGLRVLK